MTDSVLLQAFVYLAAAVIGVPLAKKVGLGAVLGYLLAGILIGPHVLGLVGREGHEVMHFAEFGVVMMLFLVGLELKPSLLWQLRRPIFGLGGAQVVVTAAVVTAGALALGVGFKTGVAVGLTLAMSSTAIALSSLSERGLLKTQGGQSSFSVLLFQDVSVIPILAVFPLLAMAAVAEEPSTRPGWQQALLVVGAVAVVVLAGRYAVQPVLRRIAASQSRELFTAFALFLVVGIALLMQLVGLSPALGTFLAGVVLADSEYRHELEGDIEPFKGLLLGLFFLSVGAGIDFHLVLAKPGTVAGLVVAVMAVKAGVLLALGRLFGLERPARWMLALSLCQVGEFAFVLLSFGQKSGAIPVDVGAPLVAATAVTMLLTPLFFVLLERVVLPRVAEKAKERKHDDVSHDDAAVVVAGFGRVGQVVVRLLRTWGHGVTVLDLDPQMVDLLRRLGQRVYYGDASRLDLLTAAGCAKAKLFVLAIDDPDKSVEVADLVRRNFPNLPIVARARNRAHAYQLRRRGIRVVVRETMGSSLELGAAAMVALGARAHSAHRYAERWRAHDESNFEKLLPMFGQDAFFGEAKRAIDAAEAAMRDELNDVNARAGEEGWDNEGLREGARAAK